MDVMDQWPIFIALYTLSSGNAHSKPDNKCAFSSRHRIITNLRLNMWHPQQKYIYCYVIVTNIRASFQHYFLRKGTEFATSLHIGSVKIITHVLRSSASIYTSFPYVYTRVISTKRHHLMLSRKFIATGPLSAYALSSFSKQQSFVVSLLLDVFIYFIQELEEFRVY